MDRMGIHDTHGGRQDSGCLGAGVEMQGIINWMTMLEHADPMLQEYEKSLLGDPVKDRASYDAVECDHFFHPRSFELSMTAVPEASTSKLVFVALP